MEAKVHAHIHPSSARFTMQLSQGSVSTFNRALSPMMVSSFGQSLYREPLRLRAGVTSSQHGIRPVSPGITPALSLLRAHAPNLNPLTASVLPLYRESLQVAARPCWKQALPSVISANLSPDACTHTPVVLLVHIPVSSQETSAFITSGPTRHSTICPYSDVRTGDFSGLQ
jgi:hypothetical protein